MEIGYFALYSILTIITLLYFLVKKNFSYFKDRGLPHLEPIFPHGNCKKLNCAYILAKFLKETYEKYKNKAPLVGFQVYFLHVLIPIDLELTKNILIKDFNNFADRGIWSNEKDDPLSGHLFALDGQKWKKLRNKLSPTFTSGKMKFMFPTVLKVGEQFSEVLGGLIDKSEEIEIKELLARFTTDVIGTCAFGIDCNSLKDPNAEFRRMGKRVFTHQRHGQLLMGFIFSAPEVAKFFKMKVTEEIVENFFLNVVRETMDYRERNNVRRNDFMDLLIDVKNEMEPDGSKFSVEEMAAQAFVFFLAGFETSSTTMGFCLYELALNPDVQDKMRQEINDALEANDGKFTYECMSKLVYMEQVISETLRKYPPVVNLIRTTRADYAVENSDYVIPKGLMLFVPVYAIHHDPEIYPDPEKFDPDRFLPENIQSRHSVSWLPFGDGPRNCIGLRFGKMQTRIGLVQLLRHFKFSISTKTPIPLVYDEKAVMLASEGGIILKIEKL